MMSDPRDKLILALCEKLSICSCLLTRAAERLEWNRAEVQDLMRRLGEAIEVVNACVKEVADDSVWTERRTPE